MERCKEVFLKTRSIATSSSTILGIDDDTVDGIQLTSCGLSVEAFSGHVLSIYKKMLDTEAFRKSAKIEKKQKASSQHDKFIQGSVKKTPEQLLNEAIDQRMRDQRGKPSKAAPAINKTGLAVAAMAGSMDHGDLHSAPPH